MKIFSKYNSKIYFIYSLIFISVLAQRIGSTTLNPTTPNMSAPRVSGS